jgi:hypothetical protein
MIANKVATWLRSLPNITDVKPCRVKIGRKEWEGAEYVHVHQWQAWHRAVQLGEHQAGEEYTERIVYLVGDLPPAYKRANRVCFPYGDYDWYVTGYYKEPRPTQYHPFGKSFMLCPWYIENQPDNRIDDYEPYRRVPMTMEYL